jgi:hypothetical protein
VLVSRYDLIEYRRWMVTKVGNWASYLLFGYTGRLSGGVTVYIYSGSNSLLLNFGLALLSIFPNRKVFDLSRDE